MKKCTAVVGCGLWGRNIVRNFYNLGALHSVCDLDKENLKMIEELYPDVSTTSDFNELLINPEVVALCIVTPSHTHFNLVKKAILAGKHVYVEKPISTSSSEAKELKDLADEMNVKLLVGLCTLMYEIVKREKYYETKMDYCHS